MDDDYELATRRDLKNATKNLDKTLFDIETRLAALEESSRYTSAHLLEIFGLVRRGIWFLVFVQVGLYLFR